MLHFDSILTSIGEFGYYQKRLAVFICLLAIPGGVHVTSVVFTNFTPSFRCAVPGLSNDTYDIQNTDHGRLVKDSIPYDEDLGQLSQCKYYAAVHRPQDNSTVINSTRTCTRWVYEQTSSGQSLAVEFNLVCDRAIYKAHVNMVMLAGVLVGSLLGGILSDFFGRKTVLILSLLIQAVLGGAMAFVQSMALMMTLRFLITVLSLTSYLSLFVLLMEMVGVSMRSVITMAALFGYVSGCYVLALVQFLIRDWRTAQMVQSLPFLACGLAWWLIQESPRWLLTKNRTKEAKAIITYMAKLNGTDVPIEMKLLDQTEDDFVDSNEDEDDDGKDRNGYDVKIEARTNEIKLWHICSRPKIAIRFTIVCFSWIVVNMVYYGLVLGVGGLIEGDIYFNYVLQATMGLIAHFICACIIERIGRKKIFCSSMLLSGGSTLGIGLLILTQAGIIRWMSIVLYCLGKFWTSMGFNLIYVITTELLPTKIRNSGLGFCSFVARFSGIVSPYIASSSLHISGPMGRALPLLIFGTLSFVSGFSAILLPETRNVVLPESFDDDREQYHRKEESCLTDSKKFKEASKRQVEISRKVLQ